MGELVRGLTKAALRLCYLFEASDGRRHSFISDSRYKKAKTLTTKREGYRWSESQSDFGNEHPRAGKTSGKEQKASEHQAKRTWINII